MARYPHELEDIFARIHSPHHHKCSCQGGGEIEILRNVSFIPSYPRARDITPRIVQKTTVEDCCCDCRHHSHPSIGRKTTFRDCCCDCHHHVRRCSCGADSADSLFQFPTTHVKEITTISADPTHHMLHRWFKRYMHNDGYLGEEELKKLVQSLGGSLNKRPIRKALKEADADGDDQLSFREFLQMWHQAASHENDFLDATGCQDIVDIANEYDLSPNVSCEDCDRKRYHSGKEEGEQEEEDPTKCNCGSEEDISPSDHRPEGKTWGSAVTKIGELPFFSCNRLPACRPKNWREPA